MYKMEKQDCYYIIPTQAIGGAEKRFIELCCYLRQNENRFNFHLIISEQLYTTLKANPEIYKLIQPMENNILRYDIDFNKPVLQFQKELYSFICSKTTTNDILHFILSFPAFCFPLKHKKTVYSLTESSLSNVNFKGRALYLLNILRAKYVDILDPAIHKKVSRYFFFKRKNILLTPGSFVDANVFKPVAGHQKENRFVFLGRFFFVKQVVELLHTLPEVCNRLNASGISDYKFIFLGYGQLEKQMLSILGHSGYRHLPIEISMSNKPEEILARSKVFFSVQLRNNYPSKSLMEAMAAGNIPLVTDVGDTRKLAAPEFSYYIPENFSATDIADRLISILSLDEATLLSKMNAARNFIVDQFKINVSANYYAGIYKRFT
jgi:glycosyltransferase involved in cell wall biosynthesis